MRLAGFVLAGGRSRRMGQDKALLAFRGQPLGAHLAGLLARVADSAHIVGDPVTYGHLGYPVLGDLIPGCGPAGGLYTALCHTQTQWIVIVACDMPHITEPLLRALAQHAARDGEANCIVPLGPDGQPEPLCALYHQRCRPVLEQAISEKRLRMRDLVTELKAVLVSPAEANACFANVNTPADWRQLEEQAK
jgi:molybdopterin-guanine dinucleotide biosynthesis protein A